LNSETDLRSLLSFGPSMFCYIRPRGRRSRRLIIAAGACTILTAIPAVWGSLIRSSPCK
jgi:hypothetical protein